MTKTYFPTENKFQEYCNGVLTKLNVHFVHIPQGNKHVRKGILDLLCWYKGRSFIVELKQQYKKLKPEQAIEWKRYEEQNIPVYLCYAKEEFIEVLKREMVINARHDRN